TTKVAMVTKGILVLRVLRFFVVLVLRVFVVRVLRAFVVPPHTGPAQRHTAVRTLERGAALPAEHGRRITAAVEQHLHLFAACESVVDGGRKVAADDDVRTRLG